MTPREIAIAKAFKRVTFYPGTVSKRFARDMVWLAEHEPKRPLTARQAQLLTHIAFRFRRQLPAHLGYPIIDDGSDAAALGHEAADAKPVERPLSKRDTLRADRAAKREAKRKMGHHTEARCDATLDMFRDTKQA